MAGLALGLHALVLTTSPLPPWACTPSWGYSFCRRKAWSLRRTTGPQTQGSA